MNECSRDSAEVAQFHNDDVGEIVNAAFRGKPHADSAVAVIGSEHDPRMMAQHCAYTIHRGERPLEAMQDAERVVRRYRIRDAARMDVRKGLGIAGIRRETLFPDLENLAKTIADGHLPDKDA